MEFEYDPAKSAKNLAKHGIDFEAAQRMWDNSKTVTLTAPNPGNDDVRYIVLGMIDGVFVWLLSAVGALPTLLSASPKLMMALLTGSIRTRTTDMAVGLVCTIRPKNRCLPNRSASHSRAPQRAARNAA
mgnify:CR=1 FL=1